MPTIATRPSLEVTQAVGALLLHQFTRDRFLEAGIDESLIREAEDREQLNALAATLLEEDGGQLNETNGSSHNATTGNTTGPHTAGQADENGPQQLQQPQQQHQNDDSRNVTGDTSYQTSGNNSTVRLDDLSRDSQQQDGPGELFHSIAESSMNGTPQRADRTIYHSMNVSGPHTSESPFERLQASPNFASYGRELRRVAEEFEKSQLRQDIKQYAGQVDLREITRESFVELLQELFEEKITREKVVILFFFCTDVALRAALSAEELVVKLLGWSFSYIVNTVCSFVYKLGGWDEVLFYNFIFHQLPSIMITCCALMAMLWFGVNIRRVLRS